MHSITDGEFRRAWFHLDFLQQLDGVAVTGSIAASSDAAQTVHLTPPKLSVVGRLGHPRDIQVDAPYAALDKADVIRRGAAIGVPFELTLSCMNPSGTRHCGACSKCRERHDAFVSAGVSDPTDYHDRSFVTAKN